MESDHRPLASHNREESTKKTSSMDEIAIAVAESKSPNSVSAADEAEHEHQVHIRTWFALLAMWIFNFAGVLALNGPPTILSTLGLELHDPANQTWIPNALSLVQAVICPFICSISDVFQRRKSILVVCAGIAFVGAAIAPNASSIGRLIAAQTLIGFGFACIPLVLSVPSEIVPRRWRPQALAMMNVAASLGASVGPLVIGSLTRTNVQTGWRYFYFQMALWGFAALGVIIGYQPPKRHTRLDHLTFVQKLGHIDILGGLLITAALTLVLAALNLGGVTFPWASAQVLVPLVLGLVVSGAVGLYEWKGTDKGILHHDLFRLPSPYKRTFIICIGLILVEGFVLFSYVIFYPVLTEVLFETDPLLVAVRIIVFWLASAVSTMIFGYVATRYKTIKIPLIVGYTVYTAGIVGLATIQPGDNASCIAFAIVAGLGFGGPLVMVFTGVQLSIPHSLLATATALITSSRAIAASVSTAIYAAVVSSRLGELIPTKVAQAAIGAGLPPSSVGSFIGALTDHNAQSANNLARVPGVNPTIIGAGVRALKQAYADGLRDVYIIAAAVGAVGVLLCFFVGDLSGTMNYHIDATVEKVDQRRTNDSEK